MQKKKTTGQRKERNPMQKKSPQDKEKNAALCQNKVHRTKKRTQRYAKKKSTGQRKERSPMQKKKVTGQRKERSPMPKKKVLTTKKRTQPYAKKKVLTTKERTQRYAHKNPDNKERCASKKKKSPQQRK